MFTSSRIRNYCFGLKQIGIRKQIVMFKMFGCTSKQKVILISESLEQIGEITSKFKQERLNQQERNVQIIKDLKDKVQNLKDSQVQQFEKITCTLEKWVQMISNQEEEFTEKIDSVSFIDIDEFINFTQDLDAQKLSYNDEFKLDLKQKLEALIENNIIGYDLYILVFQYSQQNKNWNQIQKIQTSAGGYRLCFISDNQISWKVYSKEKSEEYTKRQGIKIKKGFDQNCFFPQQYIKQKQLLINKSGSCINMIKVLESGQLMVEQCIEFETNYIFGATNNNGDYLVTWDYVTKDLQLRKYQE
ncbi:unnamed protein product (macronuclear) [Paramecium tetraurelia]|uniref:TLDc domain-containing protein n=1 Tax=Paramecium tetraurelia TaxID=5888 RepID=A0BHA4_PARTE|nr:uncharacterized protein GSPATT00028956001 [Paramecium tetraurelia]CAK57921.1 unnamed protein product [Paramecium tetraurelia]|eukprot:XP_001425319.1 hypothetical protein (macronuclear) [Paramecium tetraurelia strain d4-2]